MKRLFLVFFGLLVIFASFSSVFASDYPPSVLFVAFQPGAIDSLWEDSTGMPCCGIACIDSINRANNCAFFLCTGDSALHEELNCYHIFFADTGGADLLALADAYLEDPNVAAASPDYYVKYNFTPNDPYFNRYYG